LQPQPFASTCGPALAVPQHDAFADGSQHDACSVAEQQVESGAAGVPLAAVAPTEAAWISVVPY
jgi:hypothetical protein